MTDSSRPTLLVTGASGNLGRRVVELLLEAGRGSIVAGTRSPEKLADLSDGRVEIRRVDFDDTVDALAKALAGVERLLLISTDTVGQPGRRFEQHKKAIDAAVRAGVQHIVYTSLAHPVADSPVLIADDHRQTEDALEASGIGYTSLRNNLYTDLLLMSLPPAVASGRIFAAAGDGGAAYVTREDCARAAASALMSDFAGIRALEITGPSDVTYAQLADMAAELTGRRVEYVPVDEEQLASGMVQAGVPGPLAQLMASFDTGMRQGLFGPATKAVEELTGRAPTSVREFLEAHRTVLVPSDSTPENEA